jgi:hypothetical protein
MRYDGVRVSGESIKSCRGDLYQASKDGPVIWVELTSTGGSKERRQREDIRPETRVLVGHSHIGQFCPLVSRRSWGQKVVSHISLRNAEDAHHLDPSG